MQVFDFVVYYESRVECLGGCYRLIETPTELIVPENVRCLVAAIPGLKWLRIYDRLYKGMRPYLHQPLPDEGACFYIRYGNQSDKWMLASSEMLIVHRNTGEIFYRGSANDEG